jgi:short-subunit dehydrogenase
VLVTGCNRGIGLQLCKQLTARGDDVIGVCRSESDELNQLGVRTVAGIDIGRADAMPRLRAAIGDQHIDVLINNAGMLRPDKLGELDYEEMAE